MKLASIPETHFHNYRGDVMFDAYKWDLQAGEQSTISDKVLLLELSEASYLSETAVQLYHETIAMERALQKSPELVLDLGVSQKMTDALCSCSYIPENHIRFMRFDFHPTTEGWQISEVNSDVPAGYPEASILPALAEKYFDGYHQYGCFGDVMQNRLASIVLPGSAIAYIHDTHVVEDHQILHYIGDIMEKLGYKSVYAAPENIKWANDTASDIGGIFRYFPVEWLEFISNADWMGYINSKTPSCNHPIALLTQSKRLPLVWDKLGTDITLWQTLLPETKCANMYKKGWILKPAFGRVGEGITIPGTMSKFETDEIRKAAKLDPTQWVAQKMFTSAPIDGLHINVGAFVIDGQFAGFYARVSNLARINEDASEIPILVRS